MTTIASNTWYNGMAIVFGVGAVALFVLAFTQSELAHSSLTIDPRQSESASLLAMMGFTLCSIVAFACSIAARTAARRDTGR